MDSVPLPGHCRMVHRRSWRWLTAVLVFLICAITVAVADSWGLVGRQIGAYVTDCADNQCDYHWTADTVAMAGRLPGGQWRDGHVTRLWWNPDDLTEITVDAGKEVPVNVVWFAVFGSGLLAFALLVPGRSVWLYGGRTRRGISVVMATCAIVVAALPTAEILTQLSRRPPVSVPPLTAPTPIRPILQQVVPLDPTVRHDVDTGCARALAMPGSVTGPVVDATDPSTDTSTVELPDGANGHPTTRRMPGVIMSVALAPTGSFATGDTDGIVRLWDAAGERMTTAIVGSWVNSVVFSPDGRTLAVAGDTVVLWDLHSLRTVATLTGADKPWRIAFSADGDTLSVCDESGTTQRWRISK